MSILVVIVKLLVAMCEIASHSINTVVGLHEISTQFNFQLSLTSLYAKPKLSDINFLRERVT